MTDDWKQSTFFSFKFLLVYYSKCTNVVQHTVLIKAEMHPLCRGTNAPDCMLMTASTCEHCYSGCVLHKKQNVGNTIWRLLSSIHCHECVTIHHKCMDNRLFNLDLDTSFQGRVRMPPMQFTTTLCNSGKSSESLSSSFLLFTSTCY